jgi:hypothetical protein
VIKGRWMRYAGNAARIGEMKNAYRIFSERWWDMRLRCRRNDSIKVALELTMLYGA